VSEHQELSSPLDALEALVHAHDRRAPDAKPWPTARERAARDHARAVLEAHGRSPRFTPPSKSKEPGDA
jgi:hypothetical protein